MLGNHIVGRSIKGWLLLSLWFVPKKCINSLVSTVGTIVWLTRPHPEMQASFSYAFLPFVWYFFYQVLKKREKKRELGCMVCIVHVVVHGASTLRVGVRACSLLVAV